MERGNLKRKYAALARRASPAHRRGPMARAEETGTLDLRSLAVAVEIAVRMRPPAPRKPLPLEARAQLIPRPHRSRRLLPPEPTAGD